jgi:hypothetical protein
VAVFAISAVGATAAQAAFEGPSWLVNTARLVAPATKKLKSNATNMKLSIPGLGITMLCKKTTNTGEIIGSAAENVGTDKAAVTFTECSVEGKAECKVRSLLKKGTVETAVGTIGPINVKTELVSLSAPPVTKSGDLFINEEENAKNEPVFVTIKIEACGLATGTFDIKGNTVAKMGKHSGGGLFEEGKAGEEFVVGWLNFPATAIKKVWKWNAATKVYTETAVGLKFGAFEATQVGEIELELETKEKFGWLAK